MKTGWKNIVGIERQHTFLIVVHFHYTAEAPEFVFSKRCHLTAPKYKPVLY